MSKINVSLLVIISLLLALIVGVVSKLDFGVRSVLGDASAPALMASTTNRVAMPAGLSQQLLGTSTKRVAASIQAVNCLSGGTVYLAFDNLTATIGNGYAVVASSTAFFSDADESMLKTGVKGVVSSNTCDVIVTEWRLR